MDFSDVTIFIPTKGRADKQVTLAFLGDELRGVCTLLVDSEEFDDYRLTVDNVNIIAMPPEVKGIGKVRQWAVDNCLTLPMPFTSGGIATMLTLSTVNL